MTFGLNFDFRYVPQITIAYLIYRWANEENYKFNRKDPKLYENDT